VEEPGGGDDARARLLLDEYVDAVVELVSSGRGQEAPALADATMERLVELDPDTPDVALAFLKTRTRQRTSAYLRCASLATDEAGWCDQLAGAWPEEHVHCKAVAVLWTLLGHRVMRQGQSCDEVLAEPGWIPAFLEPKAGELCTAMATGEPEACPYPQGTEDHATCVVVAARDATACHEVTDDSSPDWWPGCCERFVEQFVEFVSEPDAVEHNAAAGAASGDLGGCERALRTLLHDDLAGFFHVPGAVAPPESALTADEASCRLIMHWMPPPLT
jgi:hypothetical protein